MRGALYPFPLNLRLNGDVFIYEQGQVYYYFAQAEERLGAICGEGKAILA
jgi:hypothetical protein